MPPLCGREATVRGFIDAGYAAIAGGIVSAALDGMKIAEAASLTLVSLTLVSLTLDAILR